MKESFLGRRRHRQRPGVWVTQIPEPGTHVQQERISTGRFVSRLDRSFSDL